MSVTIHPSSTCVDDASVLVASSKGMVELWVLGGGGGGDARGESAFSGGDNNGNAVAGANANAATAVPDIIVMRDRESGDGFGMWRSR